ncbi:fungal-specific transcription factor domain-containing protein [Infundibulicybe gibba]|nr:fungal-specific transcription factor domain-containing protein [Infundibulicybe gibba]
MQSTGPHCYTSQPGTSLNVFQLDALDSSPPSADSPYLDPGVYETELEARRRIDRACDACRRRKTKCDGPRMSDNICSNCTQARKLCTYVEASKPRGPPKAYITGLEDKLEKLEAILRNLYPGQDFLEELGPPVIRGSWKTGSSGSITSQIHHRDSTLSQRNTLHSDTQHQPISAKSSTDDLGRHRAPGRMRQTSHLIFNAQSRVHIPSSDFRESTSETEASDNSSLDTDSGTPAVVRASRKLKLRENEAVAGGIDYQNRYHGKSSPVGLIDAARKFKELTIMEGSNPGSRLSSDQPRPYLASNLPRGVSPGRSVFWTSPRWELMWEGIHDDSPEVIPSILLAFPPADLARDLIDLYFLHVNPQVPLLHRPTFEKQWKESLHHRNMWYACLVMCVFAVASRWSDDARVLPENLESPTGELDWGRAGWSYFYVGLGVHRVRRSLLYPATLFEVQTFTLLAMFLRGTASYPVGLLVLSVGLRKAQDVGSHQKKTYQNKPNVNEELWKRAFWCLVVFDRLGAASLGRACCVGEEDYDLDMPLEVDDEYWETDDPDLAFQQPAGVPSHITFFNHFIRLTQIMAFSLKTIYAVNKSQLFPGIIYKDWRNDVLDQLNSALANWEATVPAYLRWSDNFSDQILANQVATLHTTYHLTKMMILRPFLPSVPAECSSIRTGFITSSLEKSLESALSCLRVLKQERRFGLSNYPNLINVAHLTAGTLLVRVWELESQKDILADVKPPIAQSIDLFMVDVRICLNFLGCIQHRWPFASSLL